MARSLTPAAVRPGCSSQQKAPEQEQCGGEDDFPIERLGGKAQQKHDCSHRHSRRPDAADDLPRPVSHHGSLVAVGGPVGHTAHAQAVSDRRPLPGVSRRRP
ncbi:hypothetical protein Van01_35020 [Micromonospora andamanensis]|uniref:Uncharacterized protein n=1 Tax=Micromonospora andamanensis TaxID=1287068 RepID=A0ABQ4HXB5_9ACTN|nr:hypothetical protein Van01_35020 [Micromonospora andamanensis]